MSALDAFTKETRAVITNGPLGNGLHLFMTKDRASTSWSSSIKHAIVFQTPEAAEIKRQQLPMGFYHHGAPTVTPWAEAQKMVAETVRFLEEEADSSEHMHSEDSFAS
jgi:hypothetical protein